MVDTLETTAYTVAGNLSAQVDEPLESATVAATYARIAAAYEQIEATGNVAARDAAGRLVGDAYRLLIDQAANVTNKSADDLYALGACHEGLGDRDAAEKLYAQSLVAKPSAKVHWSSKRSTCGISLTMRCSVASTCAAR